MTIKALSLLPVVLSIASFAAAQNSSPVVVPPPVQGPGGTAPYTVKTNARLVVLDMVVVDAKGKAVKGLGREHFHITEAGQAQTITGFEEAGQQMAPATGTINSTAELDRVAPRAPVNIILLDEFNTRFEDMAFARYSLKKYLSKEPGTLSTPTMLLAVDLQHFKVLVDYTQDRAKILDALDHHFAAYPWQSKGGGWVIERYELAFLTLRRVAEAVEGHPGHKNMIWIGRGFPPIIDEEADVDTNDRTFQIVQDTVNKLRDARVTLYTIDPAGLQIDSPNGYGSDADFLDPFGNNFEFARLATATGGRALYGRNDVDAQIGSAIEDGSSFYTATYRPTSESENDQKFRRIKATVDIPGLSVVAREGYYLPYAAPKGDLKASAAAEVPTQVVISDMISAMNSRMSYDGLQVSAALSPTTPGTFNVHVDAGSVTWFPVEGDKPRHAEVVILAETYDKKGRILKHAARELRVNATRDVEPEGRLDLPLDLTFALARDPAAARARFVVRMNPQGKIGTADVPLTPQ